MQLCLNTSCFCSPFVESTVPLATKVAVAAEAGYTHLEMWIKELDDHVAAGGSLAEVKALLDDHGLTCPSVITLFGWSAAGVGAAELAECRRRMEVARAVGSQRIVATPSGPRQPEFGSVDLDDVAARYRALLELGDSLGIWPMMEFLGFFGSIYALEQAQAVVELADHPQATLVLDPFHLWRGGSGFNRVAQVPAAQIGICHFNDAPASDPPRFEQLDADRVYPGQGCLPLVALLRTLVAAGYQGPLSLELFNPGYWALPVAENIARGLAATRQVLAAAGL
ncbi:MAG: sugar phosphate isomerase/epimerase [Fimbriimonadaceae bacterium]|nr:sugar phosphate isomerase/epimerase [Fimbriimonadaceae bacterium]